MTTHGLTILVSFYKERKERKRDTKDEEQTVSKWHDLHPPILCLRRTSMVSVDTKLIIVDVNLETRT